MPGQLPFSSKRRRFAGRTRSRRIGRSGKGENHLIQHCILVARPRSTYAAHKILPALLERKSREKKTPLQTGEKRLAAVFLASLRGVEPPAYRLGGGRSIHLSYRDISQVWLTGGAGLGLQENECPYGVRRKSTRRWCEGRDLNPQGYPHAPQTCASASSATLAYLSCGAVGAVCRTA